jgi:hypothetical protein
MHRAVVRTKERACRQLRGVQLAVDERRAALAGGAEHIQLLPDWPWHCCKAALMSHSVLCSAELSRLLRGSH